MEEEEDCTGFNTVNLLCHAEEAAGKAIGDNIKDMANAVMEAVGKAVGSLGTIWVNIGTPDLTDTSTSSSIAAGERAATDGIDTVLNYVMWVSLSIAILSLIALGAQLAIKLKTGDGIASIGRMGYVLGAVVLVSGASALISGFLPNSPNGTGGAVLFLQSSLWWYMGAAAIVSVMIGGARMAWEQRAEPGREIVKSLLTLVVVAGAGVTVVGLLVSAADSFSIWIINGALECEVDTNSACFSKNMLTLLALTPASTDQLGALLVIILGTFAILAAVVQILLMVARGGMLVILAGILPLSASFTNTEMGKNWFRKCISWLVAFILYKPAAAIVYAAAFQLVDTNVFTDDGTGLLSVLTGLMLMMIALFAMPALMRFVTPMVSATTSGNMAGAAVAGAMATLPSGAAHIGRLASGSGGGSQGPSGGQANSSQAPTGGGLSGGNASRAAQTSGGQIAGAGSGSAAAVSGGSIATAGGGTAAARQAGGPAGIAESKAKKAAKVTPEAASSLGEDSTGEDEGEGNPSGSS